MNNYWQLIDLLGICLFFYVFSSAVKLVPHWTSASAALTYTFIYYLHLQIFFISASLFHFAAYFLTTYKHTLGQTNKQANTNHRLKLEANKMKDKLKEMKKSNFCFVFIFCAFQYSVVHYINCTTYTQRSRR